MSRKTMLLTMLVLFAWVTMVPAGAPTDNGDKNAYSVYTTDVAIFTNDTLLATTTIDTIMDAFYPKAGFEYIASFKAFTGSGADSVDLQVLLEAMDPNGALLASLAADTITATAGAQVLLPFGTTIIGTSYRMICQGITGQGGIVVPEDTVYVYRRRAYTYTGK